MSIRKLVDRARTVKPSNPIELPSPFIADNIGPDRYIMSEGLENAVNAALELGQPLLLTGDPGTGKTQFAHYLAWQLGLTKPIEFHTKSSTVLSDLFYSYNAVGRFHAAQTGTGSKDDLDYIHFNGLGRAILMSRNRSDNLFLERHSDPELLKGPLRSVVLIDEIDKASRDFPNDLLHEIAAMSFRISELGMDIAANCDFRPIIVITSNRERPLPDPFLRRCVFYNIEPPSYEQLIEIVTCRFGYRGEPPPLVRGAVSFYSRAKTELVRPPSTPEFIAWYQLLRLLAPNPTSSFGEITRVVRKTFSVLAKNEEDQETLELLLRP